MDGLGIIVIVIAAIASIIGEAGKKKRPDAPPPRPSPRPRPRAVPGPGPGPAPGRASDMVPEDFWRELTGQPKPQSKPKPQPPLEVESWDDEAIAAVEAENRELQTQPEARSLEEYRRPEVVRRAPVVVSLEAHVPSSRERHEAFHRKVDTPKATPAPPPAAAPASTLLHRLRAHGDAREAVLIAEIFGPPKGLEDDPLRS